jgi:hypothetical protein
MPSNLGPQGKQLTQSITLAAFATGIFGGQNVYLLEEQLLKRVS